jgi:Protein kinase domain
VAHRDLKLSNVLLAERPRKGTPPRLVLCDLGTAKVTQNMDRCETFVGTPGFMSPQVLASMLNVASGGTPTVPAAHQLVHPGGQLQQMGSEERGSRKAHGSRPGLASHLAAAASESDEGSGSGSRSSDMRGSGGGHTYNAAKADAWALGALLHALLRRGELPYGYSSFASLLPPQEALLTLFELENRHSWEAAAGERGAAQVRGALSSDARHLLSGLLHPDEAQRLSLEEVAEHPWVTAPLPSSHAAVLADVEARAATIAAAARPGAPDADAARTLTAAVVDAMFALLEAAPAFMRQHLRDAPGAGPGGAVLSVPLTGAQPGTPPSAAALCDALDALRSAADAAGVVLPCLAPPASHSASPFAAAAAAAAGGGCAAKVAPLCMPGGPGSRLHDCTAHVCDDTCYGLKCYR